MLEVRSLCAGYRGKRVLDGVNMTLRAGELCALLGENGSGKSTLLRALCGQMSARYERCTLCGRDLPGMPVRARAAQVAYLPQQTRLDPGMTALEAVLMGANARTPLLGGYTVAQREQARACLAAVGLAAAESRLTGTLSQGQQRLVALARALMQQPRLFLLDEPDGALDLARRGEALCALRAAMGTRCAALVALHDPQLALSRCDRVLALCGGRVAAELDMRAAEISEVTRVMRLLYGEVTVARVQGRFAVLA